jgi:acyl carrier protein
MEKVKIREIIEDIVITHFLYSVIELVHEEDVSFEELELDSLDKIELVVEVEKEFGILIYDNEMDNIKSIKDMTDLVYKIKTEGHGK